MDKKNQKPLLVPFTVEERDALKRAAARDSRDETNEIRWLVRSYTSDHLISRELFDETVERLRRTTDLLELLAKTVSKQLTGHASIDPESLQVGGDARQKDAHPTSRKKQA